MRGVVAVVVLLAAGLAGCASPTADAKNLPGPPYVFRCAPPGGAAFTFTLWAGADRAVVALPPELGGHRVEMQRAMAADGAKYDGDGVMVWNTGLKARLQVGPDVYPGCLTTRSGAPGSPEG